MSGGIVTFVLIVLAATAAAWLGIWCASRAMRTAKRSSPGVGAAGWALLFLSRRAMVPDTSDAWHQRCLTPAVPDTSGA